MKRGIRGQQQNLFPGLILIVTTVTASHRMAALI